MGIRGRNVRVGGSANNRRLSLKVAGQPHARPAVPLPAQASTLCPRAIMARDLSNPNKIRHHMTTTAFSLENFRIRETLGVVLGITVRSRSIFGLFAASLQTLRGGRIEQFIQLCERARSEAFELMLQHAEQHGANAVVAIKYDATEIMQGVSEVLCYGTAVVVDPLTEP
jgi:uncharacterized protein YbjQ (UPF0145 family)